MILWVLMRHPVCAANLFTRFGIDQGWLMNRPVAAENVGRRMRDGYATSEIECRDVIESVLYANSRTHQAQDTARVT